MKIILGFLLCGLACALPYNKTGKLESLKTKTDLKTKEDKLFTSLLPKVSNHTGVNNSRAKKQATYYLVQPDSSQCCPCSGAGASGTIGTTGTIGTSGDVGIIGTTGTVGTTGTSGTIGTSGTGGHSGTIRVVETTGNTGTTGTIGTSGTGGHTRIIRVGGIGTTGTKGTGTITNENYNYGSSSLSGETTYLFQPGSTSSQGGQLTTCCHPCVVPAPQPAPQPPVVVAVDNPPPPPPTQPPIVVQFESHPVPQPDIYLHMNTPAVQMQNSCSNNTHTEKVVEHKCDESTKCDQDTYVVLPPADTQSSVMYVQFPIIQHQTPVFPQILVGSSKLMNACLNKNGSSSVAESESSSSSSSLSSSSSSETVSSGYNSGASFEVTQQVDAGNSNNNNGQLLHLPVEANQQGQFYSGQVYQSGPFNGYGLGQFNQPGPFDPQVNSNAPLQSHICGVQSDLNFNRFQPSPGSWAGNFEVPREQQIYRYPSFRAANNDDLNNQISQLNPVTGRPDQHVGQGQMAPDNLMKRYFSRSVPADKGAEFDSSEVKSSADSHEVQPQDGKVASVSPPAQVLTSLKKNSLKSSENNKDSSGSKISDRKKFKN
ncbi:uncharacterized protein LOC123265845 isoform X2 [Cotesia glomerata]|uniref:uncharacterized protein LOC123265845 isoform X2 n=1 Tax=Cotesia glomerata TaxID=32391 RepID=UPI001D011E14|nr:uncharacterized protein LOC123265845 isoform X2 [Cotesia glomerata]